MIPIINGENHEKRKKLHSEMEQARKELEEQASHAGRYHERAENIRKEKERKRKED